MLPSEESFTMFPFKKKQQQSAAPVPGKMALPSAVTIQTRRAQHVEEPLGEAIRRVCRENSAITACYLLDARKPDADETGLIIALTVDDEAHQMDQLARQFQQMLRGFPERAPNTMIMSSASFLPRHEGAEFYSR
jgi:hypothetical protein